MITKQEAFNKVWNWFIVMKNPKSQNSNGFGCLYNGANGALCAFAVVTPVELRDHLYEGTNAAELIKTDAKLAEYFGINEKEFYRNLQAVHDCASKNHSFTEAIKGNLTSLATHYNLTIPS